jgi:cytoskeletal protein CcmA (bactofilin family)
MQNRETPTPSSPVTSGTGALIGSTMRINGDIYSKDEIQLNGELTGSLKSEGRLTVGETGKADATLHGDEVVIAGTVKGNVDATRRIVLRKGANLVGDVKTAGIVIEDGAYFRGGIDITRPANAASATSGS